MENRTSNYIFNFKLEITLITKMKSYPTTHKILSGSKVVEGTKPHKCIVSLHQIETSLKEKHVSKKERKGKKKRTAKISKNANRLKNRHPSLHDQLQLFQ